jgi:hypothetical protein
VIESKDDDAGVANLAAALPAAYAESGRLASIAQRHGKTGVAKYLSNKLPTKVGFRSGDMGEILATAYLHEEAGWVVGPCRLIHRDHPEWAMRGDDVLGARLNAAAKVLVIRGEAKSRVKASRATVTEAREGLSRDKEMPSSHSLTQFADRLMTMDATLGNAVQDLLLFDDLRADRVRHLMFLFTGNDPRAHVADDLLTYTGAVRQLTITMRVRGHKEFIKAAYEAVITDAS